MKIMRLLNNRIFIHAVYPARPELCGKAKALLRTKESTLSRSPIWLSFANLTNLKTIISNLNYFLFPSSASLQGLTFQRPVCFIDNKSFDPCFVKSNVDHSFCEFIWRVICERNKNGKCLVTWPDMKRTDITMQVHLTSKLTLGIVQYFIRSSSII